MKLANLGALALSACLAGGCLAGCAPEPRIAVPDTGPAEEQPLAAATQEPAEEADVGEATPAAAEPESEPVHEHIWLPNYELQVIPAQTETIHHDAVTEEAVELHTVCNVCLAIVDGVADQHAAETGHVGATPDVEVPVTRTVTEASDEVREISPETTQLVSTSDTCTTCGETRQTDKKTVDPETVSQAVQDDAGSPLGAL
ncbi:hypothetical protein [Adlercreutzia caecimuris]|uniref:hypothetical protein n=1 Tax=Adlercreutzia caecimuris TaxID=671266 RepID=UPI001C3CDF8A|nr:hypothetical protein [Adlercreutzia caecimuris]